VAKAWWDMVLEFTGGDLSLLLNLAAARLHRRVGGAGWAASE